MEAECEQLVTEYEEQGSVSEQVKIEYKVNQGGVVIFDEDEK